MRNVRVYLDEILLTDIKNVYWWTMEFISKHPYNISYTNHYYVRKRDAKRAAINFARRHNFKIVDIKG